MDPLLRSDIEAVLQDILLPVNWQREVDPDTGRSYYHTGGMAAQWAHPVLVRSSNDGWQLPPGSSDDQQMPTGCRPSDSVKVQGTTS